MARSNNGAVPTEPDMRAHTSPPRPIRRLRRALVMVGTLTTVMIAAACRLEAGGRAAAALAAVACLALWCVLLEAEGRACDRLEARAHRRASARPAARSARTRPAGRRRRAA
jgi:hypothetical protein